MTCAASPVGREARDGHLTRGGLAEAMSVPDSRVRADLEIRDAAAYFDERDLASAWVVDERGHLVGCLREIDFVRHGDVSPGTTVRSIMSTAISVEERCSVHEALVRMARSHVRELAIVTAEGALVGVVRDVDGLRILSVHRALR